MPVESRMPVHAAAEEALGELASRAAALAAASGGNLLECFAAVPDPRDPRGIRHSLPCVLALCTAAVLCGNTQVEDVTAWAHAAPQEVAGRGRGQAERPGRVRPAASGHRGAGLHRAGRAGAGRPCRGVPGGPRAPRPGHVPAGRAGPAARHRGRREGGARRGRGRRAHPVPAGRRYARRRDRARRAAHRPEDERGPGVRAAAARPERVLLPDRARRHRRRRPHRQGPRQAHLRGTPGALRVHRQAQHEEAVGGTGRPGLEESPRPARDQGEKPRAARAPHHPGHGRPGAHPQAVPARTPGRPDRTVRLAPAPCGCGKAGAG